MAITLDIVREYVQKAGLQLEYSLEASGTNVIKIFKYSATAQAGYEHQLMYNDRNKHYDRMCEYALEWVLTHIRKLRESRRP